MALSKEKEINYTTFESIIVSFQFLLIIIIITITLRIYCHKEIVDLKEKTVSTQKNFLENLAIKLNPEYFIKKTFKKIILLHKKNKIRTINKIVSKFQKKLNIKLYVFSYDNRKNLINCIPQNPPNLWLMRQIMHALNTTEKGEFERYKKHLDKKIGLVFGFGKKLSVIKADKAKFTNVFTIPDNPSAKGYLYWNYDENKGGIIIICPIIPTEYKLFSTLIPYFTKAAPQKYIGIGKKNSKKWINNHRQIDELALKAYNLAIKNKSDVYETNKFIWYFLETKKEFIYFVKFLQHQSYLQDIYNIIPLISIFTLFAGILLIYISSNKILNNLKKVLAISFILASSIPILSLLLNTSDLIDSYSINLYSKMQSSLEEQIKNLVFEFENFLNSKTLVLNKLFSNSNIILKPEYWQKITKILAKYDIQGIIQIRNSAGKLLYASDFSNLLHRDELLSALSRRAIERYARNRLEEYNYKPDPFFHTLVRRDDMGFSTILNFPSKIQIVHMSEKKLAYYFTTFTSTNSPAAFLDLVAPLENLIITFFKMQKKQNLTYDNIKIRTYIFNPYTFEWLFVAPPAKFSNKIFYTALQAHLLNKPISKTLKYNKLNLVVSSIAPTELNNFIIIAVISDNIASAHLTSIKNKVKLASFIFFVFILLMSNTISRLFIDPIRFIENGLEALSNRNYEYTIPTIASSDNEFNQLAKAYNQVIYEAHEMLSAKQVQNGLMPQNFPNLENYSIYGTVLPCAELGGDYLDCIELKNNKLLFVVGDVAGHGIGSALITAFCKTFIFHLSQKERISPLIIAKTLDKALKIYYKSKLFFGMICGILDLSNNIVEFIVAGHIYPIFVNYNEKIAKFVGYPSLPLGITTKDITPPVIRVELKQNCAFLLITDGIVECIKHTSNYINIENFEQLGYDNILHWAIEAYSSDAKTYIENIISLYNKWNNYHHENDDITIFTIIKTR